MGSVILTLDLCFFMQLYKIRCLEAPSVLFTVKTYRPQCCKCEGQFIAPKDKLKVRNSSFPSHHVRTGLVLVQPGGFVLDQLLSPVAYRRPATARLLGRVDQTFTVRRPGTGGVKDLTRLYPSDFSIIQQVPYKVLTLKKQR